MSVVPVCDEVITACGLVMSGAVGDATPAEVEEATASGSNMVRGRQVSHGICARCKAEHFGLHGSASAAHELSPELVEVMA